MKKYILAFLVFLLVGCSTNKSGFTQMSMQDALVKMEECEEYILLDVRTKEEYLQGHIPKAIHLANEDIDEESVAILKDKTQMIFVYCRSGNRSIQASGKLVALGYENVIECGGIVEYPYALETGE